MAAIIKECLRESDHVGRYGGDEFIITLPNTYCDCAVNVIDRIRTMLSATIFVDDSGAEFQVTGSFGIASLDPSLEEEELIAAADNALYSAKQHGRNRVWVNPGAGHSFGTTSLPSQIN